MSAPANRVLVVYAHAEPHRSRVNRLLADAAQALPGVAVLDLYATYPDFYIDATREQARFEGVDLLVLLHPIRWYAMPALLKEWIDVVFEAGWAYGVGATGLKGKSCLLAVTTGGNADGYRPDGLHGHHFDDFLPPVEQTARLCGMQWETPLVLHGAHHVSDAELAAHIAAFIQRLTAFTTGAT